MGYEIAPRPEQCGTTAKTSEWERAGHKKRGSRGQGPRRSFLRLSPEKAGLPPGVGREPTSQVWTCDGPNGTACRPQAPTLTRRVSPPAGGERKCNHVLTGSAGQNILLTPRVPAPPARFGVQPPILGGAKNQAGSLPPSYAVFPNEAQTPVPLPKFSYRNCPVFGRTASRFCSFRS